MEFLKMIEASMFISGHKLADYIESVVPFPNVGIIMCTIDKHKLIYPEKENYINVDDILKQEGVTLDIVKDLINGLNKIFNREVSIKAPVTKKVVKPIANPSDFKTFEMPKPVPVTETVIKERSDKLKGLLRTGYTVKLQDNSIWEVVMHTERGDILINHNRAFKPLTAYTDDLKHRYENGLDIVQIYVTHDALGNEIERRTIFDYKPVDQKRIALQKAIEEAKDLLLKAEKELKDYESSCK